jgi:hypothetical protein
MTRAMVRLVVMGATLASSLAMAQSASNPARNSATGPKLTDRGKQTPPPDTELDAQVTSPVTVPTEAEGWYTFGRDRVGVEIDFEQRGLTGYLVTVGDSKTDKRAPLTFFFAKTRVGGDNIYFATHEIHRTWYEFSGVVGQTPPKEKSLVIEYSLEGMLTVHRLEADGSDSKTAKRLKFKKMGY